MLDQIEFQVNSANNYVEMGNEQLAKAIKHQACARSVSHKYHILNHECLQEEKLFFAYLWFNCRRYHYWKLRTLGLSLSF